jgi:hypothetical protein
MRSILLAATAAMAVIGVAQAASPNPECQPWLDMRAAVGNELERVLWSGRLEDGSEILITVRLDEAGGYGDTFTVVTKQDRTQVNAEACMLMRGTTNRLSETFGGPPGPPPAPAVAPAVIEPPTFTLPG